jgi:FMN phosphatase YigB (HAD superfamily)
VGPLPMNPKAVLFDLDGTLWDRNGVVRALVMEQHRELNERLGHIPQRNYVEVRT